MAAPKELLKRVPLFQGLDDKHIDTLSRTFTDRTFKAGQDITSEGGGGVLIGNLTYRADYENTVAEEKVLRRAAAEKNCDLNPPPPPAAPTPTAYQAVPPGRAGAPVFQGQSTR